MRAIWPLGTKKTTHSRPFPEARFLSFTVSTMKTPTNFRNLPGQSAIVTGASSGIGKGCAIAFGQAGVRVCVNFVGKRDGADEAVATITQAGGQAFAHECDVSNEAQVQAMFAEAVRQFGTVDILVNNAGLQADSAFTEMTF